MTVRQKRRVRNTSGKVSRKRNDARFKKRPLPMPDVIRAHWSKDQTLRENYAKLGLMVRLNGCTGGKQDGWVDNVPTTLEGLEEQWTELDGGYMGEKYQQQTKTPALTEEAVVERDADGKIIGMRFIQRDSSEEGQKNLTDNVAPELKEFAPVVEVELSEEAKAVRKGTLSKSQMFPVYYIHSVILDLAKLLASGVNKVETHMAPGEVEFCKECISKYGDDYKVR